MSSNLPTNQPLEGRRIVVTRSQAQAEVLCRHLAALGAEPIPIPTIAFTPLPAASLIVALRQIEQYNWIIFTSANAVDFFFQAAGDNLPPLPRVAASGSATAQKLQEQGITPDFVPAEFVGEQLAAGLGDLRGQRVLLPRARLGRHEIVTLLQAQGALVDDIPLYDTVAAVPEATALERLRAGVDAVTFTSPSSVRNFLKILDDAHLDSVRRQLEQVLIVCIGPTTAAAARQCGFAVHAVPDTYTIDGLITALVALFAIRQPE
ncbi:MAG: hypothetical protein Fur0021_35500 [Candidatus Promineifilaceae bacterium]